jgi:hypothetical protein
MSGSPRTTPLVRWWRELNRLGPILTLVLLVVVVIAAPQPPQHDDRIRAQHDRIRLTLDAVPLRLGDWIGEDRPLPPAAVEMLRPNAALSRDYRRIGDPTRLSVSLIHCSDVRDMGSHYPPVCYPAHGWSLRSEPGGEADRLPESWSIADESRRGIPGIRSSLRISMLGEVPVRVYRFSRMVDGLTEVRMTVFNAFILPDGSWRAELESIRDSANRRRVSREGVAQLQLVVPGWPSMESVATAFEAFLDEMPLSVFESLGSAEVGMESFDE